MPDELTEWMRLMIQRQTHEHHTHDELMELARIGVEHTTNWGDKAPNTYRIVSYLVAFGYTPCYPGLFSALHECINELTHSAQF